MIFRSRSLLAATLLLPSAATALWSADARACDWGPGLASVHPESTSTLASNDAVVLSMLEADLDEDDLQVLIDGTEVAAEGPVLFDGQAVFLSTEHHVVRLPEGSLVEGSSVTVNLLDADGGDPLEVATYTVGPADASDLLPSEVAASFDVSFVPFDEGDSCGVPDHYSAHLVLDAPLGFEDGDRSRFVEFVFYPADAGPEAAVGRTARATAGGQLDFFVDAPGDLDPSTLCARASVTDINGEDEVLVEDCALCETFPALCDDGGGETDGGGGETDGGGGETDGGGGETDGGGGESGGAESDSDSAGGAEEGSSGGCNVAGAPANLALVLLGMLGAGLRRRRRG